MKIYGLCTVVKGYKDSPAITIKKTSEGKDIAFFTVSVSNGKGTDGNWLPCKFYKVVASGYVLKDAVNLGEKDQIIISGKVKENFYRDRNGADRRNDEIQADEIYKVYRREHTQTETTYKSMKRVEAPSDSDYDAAMITADEAARIDEATGNVPF